MDVPQISISDFTPTKENLNESKSSSNESNDYEIIITQALEVKCEKNQRKKPKPI